MAQRPELGGSGVGSGLRLAISAAAPLEDLNGIGKAAFVNRKVAQTGRGIRSIDCFELVIAAAASRRLILKQAGVGLVKIAVRVAEFQASGPLCLPRGIAAESQVHGKIAGRWRAGQDCDRLPRRLQSLAHCADATGRP